MLHRITPQAFAAVKKEFGLELDLQAYSGTVSKSDSHDPLSGPSSAKTSIGLATTAASRGRDA